MADEASLFVVTATSCGDCNRTAAAVFDHPPSEAEIESVSKSIGGMFCISTAVYRGAVNQVAEEVEE